MIYYLALCFQIINRFCTSNRQALGGSMSEIYIESAFRFLEIANNLKNDRNHPGELEFFRGHANMEWRLIPSLDRKSMLGFEERLISEFERLRPEQFQPEDGFFNNLSKMQHYGLHTRLLDITENPAVALFFACCDNNETDGEIFTFQKHLDDIPNNIVLNIITELYVKHSDTGGNYNLEKYYELMSKFHSKKNVDDAFYYILNGFTCIARPQIISERIQRQSGSFMLLVNEVCPKENCNKNKCKNRELKCTRDNIPNNIEDRVKIIKIRRSLCDFTDAHIRNEQNGVHYIVKAKNKKKILSELAVIGIKKSFLFPELVNTGNDIMEDYNLRVK